MPEVYRLKYLRGRRLSVFLAIADRVIPPDEGSPGGGSLLTAGVTDWAMARMEPGLRSQLMLLLDAVYYLGFLFGGKPFPRLSESQKDRLLSFLENNRVRLLRVGFFGLKTYACMGYYTREDVWKEIDYRGPLVPDRPFPDMTIRKLCRAEMEVCE